MQSQDFEVIVETSLNATTSDTEAALTTVTDMAAFKALTSRPDPVELEGYWTPGDGGGGLFFWAAGDTTTANNGTVVQCTSGPAGRYKRIYSGDLNVLWFGAKGDGSSDDSTPIGDAATACVNQALVFPPEKTFLFSISISSGSGCQGVVGLGGKAHVKPPSTSSAGTNIVLCARGDFIVDNIFFDMPVSTDPDFAPAASAGVRFTATAGERILVQNCRFIGGHSGVVAQEPGSVSEFYIVNNVIEQTWRDGMALAVGSNIYVIGNTVQDGGITVNGTAGGIRVGASDGVVAENCIIANNIIRNFAVGQAQSTIDCYSPSFRKIVITGNIGDLNGSGIELKTDASDGNYDRILISDNLLVLAPTTVVGGAVSGIALNLSFTGTPDTKARQVVIEGNYLIGEGTPVSTDTFIAIGGAGYDLVSVKGNKIDNFLDGLSFSPTGTVHQTYSSLLVEDNDISVVGLGITMISTATAINGLSIRNNNIVAGGLPLQIANIPCYGAYIENNKITAIGSTVGMDLRDMHDSLVRGNTIKGGASSAGVTVQGTASSNLEISGNHVTTDSSTGLDAFVLSTGTGLILLDNRVVVPAGKRSVSGAASYSSAGNVRGIVISDPSSTYAGALGDIFRNGAPSSGGVKDWICTTAGNAGSATYKGTPIL